MFPDSLSLSGFFLSQVCRHVTRLVPRLKPMAECVNVPKEVCGVSKLQPQKKKRPSIMNWCYDPETGNVTTATNTATSPATTTTTETG